MKYTIKINPVLLTILSVMLLFSCQQKEWDEHYDRDGSLPGQNLYELIKQDENLSKFSELIEISGYKTLLSSTQTLTIWAPVNEALNGVDMNNVDTARLIVRNHIARFNISTATPDGSLVRMNNNKIYYFTDSGLNFGGSLLLAKDRLARNGILHKVDKRILYTNNLYEFIGNNPTTSKLWELISAYDEERFDEDLSIPIDIDDNGRTIYDTITSSYNRLFEHKYYGLGNINKEDSIYTMIIPTNNAWDAAYARISPYFKVYNKDKNIADSIQNIQTSLAVLNDLIYRGKINNPSALDSISSTSPFGTVIYDVNDLFSGGAFQNASNGLIYLTDDLHYNNTETWNKKISLEAEDQSYRALGPNTTVYTRGTSASDLVTGISNNTYIEVLGLRPSVQPSVTFSMPQVLAGKYDVYVVFVPEIINGISSAKDSTKVMFELSYIDANGQTRSKTAETSNLRTSGTEMTKMKAFSEFKFPVSDYYDQLWFMNETNNSADIIFNTKLMIMTNVSNSDFNNNVFTRRFLVDKIIFEPVRN